MNDSVMAEESFKDLYGELLGRVLNVIENPDDRARFCVNNFADKSFASNNCGWSSVMNKLSDLNQEVERSKENVRYRIQGQTIIDRHTEREISGG